MIRFAIIAVGIFMILQKLYKIIKRRIENYMDTSEKHFFNVQLASTKKEREIGLMYVKELPLDSGMLFEYPDNSYPSIWMKNTLIPLDAIFINKNARVMHIEANMEPKSLKNKTSRNVCKYVLEINGGLAEKMGIKEGDLIGTTLLSKNITDFKEPNEKKKKGKKEKGKNKETKKKSDDKNTDKNSDKEDTKDLTEMVINDNNVDDNDEENNDVKNNDEENNDDENDKKTQSKKSKKKKKSKKSKK